jgi:TonB family protein
MPPLPPLTPTPPESTGARVPARIRPEVSDETFRQSTASLIFVKLRKMIASDTQATETILGAIAVAAHSLTGATGAAVAMPGDGGVVCVGRSGETAPELGDRLNVDSGISGECLRTGVTMRCDDAARDFHVDAEVCRQLGLQSIAVVPLRGQSGRVGVLEAFSTRTYGFTEEKMEILERLAGLAEAAWARSLVTKVQPVVDEMPPAENEAVEAPAEELPAGAAEVPLARMREMLAVAQPEESSTRRKWIYAGLATAAFLGLSLLSVYGWKAWYRASVTTTASRPAAVVAAPSESTAAGTGPTVTPDVVRPTAIANPAAEIPNTWRPRSGRARERAAAKDGTQSSSAPGSEEIPSLEASSADPTDLQRALAASPALPTLGAPISQGIAGGVLLHKVKPVYPAEARRMHVQGNVVIDAVVTPEGQVGELKLVSGDPMLATSAMDAVRRWRYAPYTLNGKPIPKPTRITISFIVPQ